MVLKHYDEETEINTIYHLSIEGVELNFKDSCCPGATISLYGWSWLSGERNLLYKTIDFSKALHWTPHASQPRYSRKGVEIEYLEDGNKRWEELVTEKEADEIALRAVYDGLDVAHIAVTRTLSVGTGTIWFKVLRNRVYLPDLVLDVRLIVEFRNSEECTRFLHGDMRKLERRYIAITDVSVLDDIMHALIPIYDDRLAAQKNALRRCLPYSQFIDECPEPKTQLIRHRASNRGDDRPCYLTLHISLGNFFFILRANWSEINNFPACPLRSDAFRSLNNIHLKFPSPASQDCNPNSSSQFHQDDLTITISAREISFSTGTNAVSLGNGFTLSSEHRTVTVNYINAIMGDAFLGTINGGNNGGRNNINTVCMMSPDGSRLPSLV